MKIFSYKYSIKRTLDLIISAGTLIVLSPLLLITMGFLFFANNGKVFFIQPRPGKNGKIFRIIKFKTMNDKRDSEGNLLPDAERITPVGKIVRATSLDEIPQLINVFKGDMSLVGPRPLLVEYLPRYSAEQMRRHEVRPGITGWAQVHGRNAISWEQKFNYDVWYVDHLSFLLDAKIIWLTIKKVFKKSDINASEGVTMEIFMGND